MTIDQFIQAKVGTEVSTAKYGIGTVCGKMCKSGGALRVIVDHGERRLHGLDLVPVVWSYPLYEVEIEHSDGSV